MLVQRLPRESGTARAVLGDAVEWGATEHLLADVFDAVQVLTYTTQAMHTAKGKKPQPPKPCRRPGVKPGADGSQIGGSGGRSIAEMRELLDNWDRIEEFGVTVQRDAVHEVR